MLPTVSNSGGFHGDFTCFAPHFDIRRLRECQLVAAHGTCQGDGAPFGQPLAQALSDGTAGKPRANPDWLWAVVEFMVPLSVRPALTTESLQDGHCIMKLQVVR